MKLFNSIGHFFAWLGSKLTVAATDIQNDLSKFETWVGTPLAQAIAKMEPAAAARVTNAILALGGDALNVCVNGGMALAEGGLNVTLDEATIAAAQAAVADVKAIFSGQTVPVQTPSATATAIVAGTAASPATT